MTSITNRDYTVIMGITAFYSIILLVCILLVDIAYGLIDPRIKLTGGEERRVNNGDKRINLKLLELRDSEDTEKISKPSLSFWKDVFMRFRKNKLAMVGIVVLIFTNHLWQSLDHI